MVGWWAVTSADDNRQWDLHTLHMLFVATYVAGFLTGCAVFAHFTSCSSSSSQASATATSNASSGLQITLLLWYTLAMNYAVVRLCHEGCCCDGCLPMHAVLCGGQLTDW